MTNTQFNLTPDEGGAICALPGCTNPIEQPPGGGPRRRYCSDRHRAAAARLRVSGRSAEESGPLLFVATGHPSELSAQLAALVAQLGQVSHALTDRLAALDADTVEARIARIEAASGARIAAAEAWAADEHQVQLAAQEIAEVAEERRGAAETDRDAALEAAARAEERAREAMADAERQVDAARAAARAEVDEAMERESRRDVEAAERVEAAESTAAEATENARTARQELERVRQAADDRIAALETRQERELARVRADLDARLTAERESLTARLLTVEAERDRLVEQVARDADERTQLGRIAEAAEARATGLSEELAAVRGRNEG